MIRARALYKQMILNLTRTYFCKSCTKTYNFLQFFAVYRRGIHQADPPITFRQGTYIFRNDPFFSKKNPGTPNAVYIYRLLYARWQADADYDYGDMKRRVILYRGHLQLDNRIIRSPIYKTIWSSVLRSYLMHRIMTWDICGIISGS